MGLSAKQQIRAQRRAARRAIVGARNLAEDGEQIAEHLQPLLDHLEIGARDCVPAYEALPLEPRIDEVCRVLTARGARVLVPLTLASFDLDWADAADPERTALGVAALADARLILAPALSVDAAGTRLGQAGGCYDRALPRAAASAVIVAVLCPGEFVNGRLPADSWDHPVDAVVSAAGVAWTAYGMVRHAALPD